jgi:hypothetical protein
VQKINTDRKIYATESVCDESVDTIFPCVLLSSNKLLTASVPLDIRAADAIVPFKIGPGATGARWPDSNGFCGSTRLNRIAANPVTRNWNNNEDVVDALWK